MDVVLGIDLGTSYFKLGLFDRDGELRGLGRVPVEAETGDGTRCELPVGRFWASLRDGIAHALDESGCAPNDIRGAAYSSQANSFLLLDEHNAPLTPLVLWPDCRSEQDDAALAELWNREDVLRVTGQGIPKSRGLAAAKWRWFQLRRPQLWSRMRRVMTISDYLAFSLTGRFIGDQGTASLLCIRNMERREWWQAALQTLKMQPSHLATLLQPGSPAGLLTAEGAGRLELSAGIPFAVGSLDHHVAALGAGLGHVADLSESTGTVLACLHSTNEYRPAPDCCIGPGVADDEYYQFAVDGNGAGTLEWYQKRHAPELSIPELVSLAETVPPGCEGLIALPQAGRYDDLNGFLHRSSKHRPGHFTRAIMESTAATLLKLTDALCPEGRPRRIVATGGGARSDLWLQMKADMLGAEFVRPGCREPACMGAAMFASAACAWHEDVARAGESWAAAQKTFSPDPRGQRSYADWHTRYLAETAART